MDEALLSYYNRELAYLRKLGAEFGEKHPKIAGRLRLDRDTIEDPHVSRLIESFAFLTARIRHKLDDTFPELTEALMGVLYPDYHAPIPSLSIAQIRLIPERTETRTIAAGEQFYTRSANLGNCVYRSCFDTVVYPVTVEKATFTGQPFRAPSLPAMRAAATVQAVLRIDLCCEPGATFAELAPAQLRFYLNGQPQLTFRLYEYLLSRATAVAIARSPLDTDAVFLSPACLKPRGFSDGDAALPGQGRSAVAHRLLTEYFAFPEKFLFVELQNVEQAWAGFDEKASVYIYFDQSHVELVQGISSSTMALGCTPIVNLFQQRLEPLYARDLGYENRLRVDASHSRCADIHSVVDLYAEDSSGNRIGLQPFYGSHRSNTTQGGKPLYWHLRRETSHWFNGRVSQGVDAYVSFVDRNFQITDPNKDWVIGGQVLCTNRDLPDQLPFGPTEPKMQFFSGGAGLRIRCLTAPTSTTLPALRDATRWQLVTQLSLQHFSGADGLQTLKEVLRLYDFKQLAESRAVIDGIVSLECGLTTARIARSGRAAICQGTRIDIELDEHFYSGSGLYLFSAILSEFFAHHCTINTFVQLSVKVKQRPGSEILWPPRSGTQTLI